LTAAAMRLPLLAILLGGLPGLHAEPDAATQQAAAEAIVAQAVMHKIIIDAGGNVTHLAFSNHTAFWDKAKGEPPQPLDAAVFRRHILSLPRLQAIAIEHQRFNDDDYALLGQLKELRDVRLHYLWGTKRDGQATKDAPLFLNALPLPLTVLELKHNFAIEGGCMEKLKPQPELEKLELDTGYCTNDAVPFIKQSPKIRNLQLHRTTITDDQFQEMLAALPNLEMLEVRPNGPKDNPITGRSLRGLKQNPKLMMVTMSLQWKELPFEGGLDVFVDHPGIQFINIAPGDIKDFSLDHPAIQQLHQARPDILIRSGGKSIGGKPDAKPPHIDGEFNWDGGVTTHG
jgi:hypothetical protein